MGGEARCKGEPSINACDGLRDHDQFPLLSGLELCERLKLFDGVHINGNDVTKNVWSYALATEVLERVLLRRGYDLVLVLAFVLL
jgi:hypothetical protein